MGFITLFGIKTISGFHFDNTGRLSRWTSISGAYLVALDAEVGLQDPSSERQPLACLFRYRDPHPPVSITESQEAGSLPSQKPVLTISSFGAHTVGLLPRPEICIKRLRKIHPKINMKAKTSCQELQPHTSCWLLLLPLLTVLILLNQAEACFDELDLMSAPGPHSSVLKLFCGMTK